MILCYNLRKIEILSDCEVYYILPLLTFDSSKNECSCTNRGYY